MNEFLATPKFAILIRRNNFWTRTQEVSIGLRIVMAQLNSVDCVAVIGLGYVGLPLMLALRQNHKVIGYDISKKRVSELNSGFDASGEVDAASLDISLKLSFTSNIQDVLLADCYIITVPTPVDENNTPDLTNLIDATRLVAECLSEGNLVVYESTVYPGATEEICVPVLERVSGLNLNKGFFVGYSPERVSPGKGATPMQEIKKVTSGSCLVAAKAVDKLYGSIITAGTHLAPSIKVAEASKVIENTQRDVNIALMNEFALIFSRMKINTNDVLTAASTKWNFLRFEPGLVGGHCIGVDPYYLSYKAENLGVKPNLITTARRLNESIPKYVARSLLKRLAKNGRLDDACSVGICGLTFKEDCADLRNSKVFDIIDELLDWSVNVVVYDPAVNHGTVPDKYCSLVLSERDFFSEQYDAILIAVAHSEFKVMDQMSFLKLLKDKNSILFDLKSILNKSRHLIEKKCQLVSL